MEQLRSIIMDCLAEYFEDDENDPGCPCGEGDERCPELVYSDAAICAVIKHLRERIDVQDRTIQDWKKAYRDMETRIDKLEKRPIVGPIRYIPVSYPTPDTSGPWTQPFQPIFTCKL
jgi:hypothetical protein